MVVNALPIPSDRGLSAARIAKWIGRAVVLLCAGFWTWFVVSVWVSDGSAAMKPALSILVPLWTLVVILWRWPRVGGVLLVAGGLFAAWFFHHKAPLVMMAVPLAAVGVLQLWWSPMASAVKTK